MQFQSNSIIYYIHTGSRAGFFMHTFLVSHLISPYSSLTGQEAKHCVKVLRHQVGDTIKLVDGQGNYSVGNIHSIDSNLVQVSISKIHTVETPYQNFHLAIAPTKQMDRIEWMLEKLCEIGLGGLHLIKTDHCVRKQWKEERLHKIVESAVKQSGNYLKASISSYSSIQECLNDHSNMQHFVMQQSGDVFQQYQFSSDCQYMLWVGPEGDFSSKELDLFRAKQVDFLRLNASRLRTETAGFQAINMLHWSCGIF